MPEYNCPRCGYSIFDKDAFEFHFNKKNICEPILNDISREECLKMIKSMYCEYCKKKFERLEILNNHLNNCELRPTIIEKHKEIKDEFVYILQEREFIHSNQPIYKIGKTINPKSRLSSYPNGSRVYLIQLVEDCNETEKKMIELFDEKFENKAEIGREYYSGEIRQMIKEFKKIEK